MSEPDEDAEDLRTVAADWFVRVHSDDATGEDWLALEAWLAPSPERRAVFQEVELLWSELDDHAESLRAGSPAADDPSSPPPLLPFASRSARQARLPAWASIAAAVVVAAGIWAWRDRPPPEHVFTTARGETLKLALADGSNVELNSDTVLVARVSRTSRNLMLQRGEALFDVAKDRSHPFGVMAGDQKITVVGTQFDVLRTQGEVSVTVSRGVVEVSNAGGHGEATRLAVGDHLRHKEGASNSVLSKARLDEALAWRRGYLIYRDRPLSEVAADLDRFVPIPVETDPSVANLRFSGALKLGDEDSLLGALQSFLPVEAVRGPDHILLRSRSSHK